MSNPRAQVIAEKVAPTLRVGIDQIVREQRLMVRFGGSLLLLFLGSILVPLIRMAIELAIDHFRLFHPVLLWAKACPVISGEMQASLDEVCSLLTTPPETFSGPTKTALAHMEDTADFP